MQAVLTNNNQSQPSIRHYRCSDPISFIHS